MEDVGETPPSGNCGMSQASSGNSPLETAAPRASGMRQPTLCRSFAKFTSDIPKIRSSPDRNTEHGKSNFEECNDFVPASGNRKSEVGRWKEGMIFARMIKTASLAWRRGCKDEHSTHLSCSCDLAMIVLQVPAARRHAGVLLAPGELRRDQPQPIARRNDPKMLLMTNR